MSIEEILKQGTKSGLQKAIRRCDIDLFSKCYTFLEKYEKSWMLFRLPVLLAEECLGYTIDTSYLPNSKNWENKQVLYDILPQLVFVPKNRDAHGFSYQFKKGNTSKQSNLLRQYLLILENKDYELLFYKIYQLNKNSEKFKNHVDTIKWRLLSNGGMYGDKIIMLSNLILSSTRELHILENPISFDKNLIEHPLDLPWYCFDPHTDIGNKIVNELSKKYNVESYRIKDTWVYGISLWCEKNMSSDFTFSMCNDKINYKIFKEIKESLEILVKKELSKIQTQKKLF